VIERRRRGDTPKYFETGIKKGRGLAQKSLDLIAAMYKEAKAAQPMTDRGVGYKLFTRKLIVSKMQRVYRLLREVREQGTIPWAWVVDKTRELEKVSTWSDPDAYARCVARSCRRDFWNQQPVRCEVWSEKGTVRGVLQPVLDHYAVGFRVVHGFSSATLIHDVAADYDGRVLIVLYVGDFDPSGMFMSEEDLPARLRIRRRARHGAAHRADAGSGARAAVVPGEGQSQGSAPPLVRRQTRAAVLGAGCDGPCVKQAIKRLIEPIEWKRCESVNNAEQESLKTVLAAWRNIGDGA
jgi:hypothetical protein